MTSLIYQFEQLSPFKKIFIICASGIVSIISLIIKSKRKKLKYQIENTKIISVEELRNYDYNSDNILIMGKFISDNHYKYSHIDTDFYLSTRNFKKSKPFVDFIFSKLIQINPGEIKSIYHGRKSHIEKLNPIFNRNFNIFYFFMMRGIYSFHLAIETYNYFLGDNNLQSYLCNQDVIGVFGKKDKFTKSIFSILEFIPTVVFQGNKSTLIKSIKKDILSLEKLSIFSGLFFVCYLISNLVKFIDRKILSTKSFTICNLTQGNENCSKCKNKVANILFPDCNHFIFCNECFEKENRMCPICKIKNENIILINFTN